MSKITDIPLEVILNHPSQFSQVDLGRQQSSNLEGLKTSLLDFIDGFRNTMTVRTLGRTAGAVLASAVINYGLMKGMKYYYMWRKNPKKDEHEIDPALPSEIELRRKWFPPLAGSLLLVVCIVDENGYPKAVMPNEQVPDVISEIWSFITTIIAPKLEELYPDIISSTRGALSVAYVPWDQIVEDDDVEKVLLNSLYVKRWIPTESQTWVYMTSSLKDIDGKQVLQPELVINIMV